MTEFELPDEVNASDENRERHYSNGDFQVRLCRDYDHADSILASAVKQTRRYPLTPDEAQSLGTSKEDLKQMRGFASFLLGIVGHVYLSNSAEVAEVLTWIHVWSFSTTILVRRGKTTVFVRVINELDM